MRLLDIWCFAAYRLNRPTQATYKPKAELYCHAKGLNSATRPLPVRISGRARAFWNRCATGSGNTLMIEMKIELPDTVAEVIEQKASELGTTPDQLLSVMVTDVAGDITELDCDVDCR
jgi:hypothetical protein